MPRVHLTELAIRSFKPSEHYVTYWDAQLRGFGLRVGKGVKTFTVIRGNERERVSIGRFPDMALADARKKAKLLLGADPNQHSSVSVEEALPLFLSTRSVRQSTAKETERILRKHFLPPLRTRKLNAVRTPDIASF